MKWSKKMVQDLRGWFQQWSWSKKLAGSSCEDDLRSWFEQWSDLRRWFKLWSDLRGGFESCHETDVRSWFKMWSWSKKMIWAVKMFVPGDSASLNHQETPHLIYEDGSSSEFNHKSNNPCPPPPHPCNPIIYMTSWWLFAPPHPHPTLQSTGQWDDIYHIFIKLVSPVWNVPECTILAPAHTTMFQRDQGGRLLTHSFQHLAIYIHLC